MRTERFLKPTTNGAKVEAEARVNSSRYREIYFLISALALVFHFINFVAILAAYYQTLVKIKQDYVFVSPTVDLRWTNYALVRADAAKTKCGEVDDSMFFQATSPALSNATRHALAEFIPPRLAYPNFMDLYDFSGLAVVQYNRSGNTINLDIMMMVFCLLSFLFQSVHYYLLARFENLPRFMHYLEYAFSSPLMIMVMAVNVGILELFTVVSLAGLFCGMNVLGLCVEVMLHFSDQIKLQRTIYFGLCILVHFFGWVLFFLAIVPIWLQFTHVVTCSEHHGTPDYAYAVIVLESFLFILFGLLQLVGLVERLNSSKSDLFRYDCVHATLSLVAKTMLAWLLIAPALSVHMDRMDVRGVYV